MKLSHFLGNIQIYKTNVSGELRDNTVGKANIIYIIQCLIECKFFNNASEK